METTADSGLHHTLIMNGGVMFANVVSNTCPSGVAWYTDVAVNVEFFHTGDSIASLDWPAIWHNPDIANGRAWMDVKWSSEGCDLRTGR